MRRVAPAVVALALAMLTAGVAAGCGGEEEATPTPDTITGTVTTDTETTDTETTTDTGTTGEGDPVAGKEIFVGVGGCGSCHTLADAGTSGSIGPNLDDAAPSFELAVDRVTNGSGAMPSFSSTLSEQDIANVAAYVSG